LFKIFIFCLFFNSMFSPFSGKFNSSYFEFQSAKLPKILELTKFFSKKASIH